MKDIFKKQGYFKDKINPYELSDNATVELGAMKKNFASLDKDPYTSITNNRFRAYSNLILFPWERKLSWIPPQQKDGNLSSSYWQGNFNPEHKDAIRYFTPIDPTVKNSTLLNNIILHDYDLTFWDPAYSSLPIYVGVHFVKLAVLDKSQVAFSSPNLVHQDGEAFTFAHLFNRVNVRGGTNYISKPEWANHKLEQVDRCDIMEEFEMYEPFESYAVCDEMVSHYVSPIELDDKELQQGYREIVLIDFSLMHQWIK